MEEIYETLRALILTAVQHNNDNNSDNMAKLFDDRKLVEEYEAAVILNSIKPEIDKYIKAYLDAGATE